MVFAGYSGFFHYLQVASHELTTIGINVTKNEITSNKILERKEPPYSMYTLKLIPPILLIANSLMIYVTKVYCAFLALAMNATSQITLSDLSALNQGISTVKPHTVNTS